METLYWHDYETFGTDPRRDRPVQFAGIRTDLELNVVDKPLVMFCCPSEDVLPQPDACLVTGISPQRALAKGVREADFMGRIHEQLARPGTCTVGYNSIRFDDEVTRHGFYRNFLDPYAREWQNGNSRWDIIDLVRLTHALRPEGIQWPTYAEGGSSFRLEDLCTANAITHESAHDALSDVRATIALARLVHERQPRLYRYVFEHRRKRAVAPLLDLSEKKPILHVSGMYPNEFGSLALVVPLARHPSNPNGIIVYDLRHDPGPLLELDLDEVHRRLFTPRSELGPDEPGIPLKTVHVNKCPVLAPVETLGPEQASRWSIDLARAGRFRQQLLAAPGLTERLNALYGTPRSMKAADPEQALYSGRFFGDDDRRRIAQVRRTPPGELADLQPRFRDPRLPDLLFRFRARNYAETLSEAETEEWEAFRTRRLTDPEGGGSITLDAYFRRIRELRTEPQAASKQDLLDELEAWGRKVSPRSTAAAP